MSTREMTVIVDDRLGHVTATFCRDSDGKETFYVFRCPCGWTAEGSTLAKGIGHAKRCEYGHPAQMRLA